MSPVTEHELTLRICNGNKEAEDWMQLMRRYIHVSDDLIDEDIPAAKKLSGAERMCSMGALALRMYSHPFYVKNSNALHAIMLINFAAYTQSVKWENEEGWKGVCADWLRHGGIYVLQIIAAICGGYDHMVSFNDELWTLAYDLHHDPEGKAI